VRPFLAAASVLARYHRHTIRHLDRLGRLLDEGRRVIVVSNHALDLIDPLLFVAALCEQYHRIPHFIGHENFIFRMPLVREVAERWHVLPARRPADTSQALRRDRFLMLFPGAGTEALVRDYVREPYTLKWKDRTGFLRLALEQDAEVVFVATVGNDHMYYQSRWPMPKPLLAAYNAGDSQRYRGARLQFGLIGPHVLPAIFPLPVRLSHVVAPPLDLGDRKAALSDPRRLEALHAHVWAHCQRFLSQAVRREQARADLLDRGIRGAHSLLHLLGA